MATEGSGPSAVAARRATVPGVHLVTDNVDGRPQMRYIYISVWVEIGMAIWRVIRQRPKRSMVIH